MLDLARTAALLVGMAALALGAGGDPPAQARSQQAPRPRWTQADRAILSRVMAQMGSGPLLLLPGDRITKIGLAFLGTPYVVGSLDLPGDEALVCNLRGLDCVTFVENCLAISRTANASGDSRTAYLANLASLRYRNPAYPTYSGRLHYLSDWIGHNQAGNWFLDKTRDLGGTIRPKKIDFMSTHPDSYPKLAEAATLAAIREVEGTLSRNPIAMLPSEKVPAALGGIHSGDILAFATSLPGLDFSHVGLAYRDADGILRLLHAREDQEVKISPESLVEYLQRYRRKVEGVMVLRPH